MAYTSGIAVQAQQELVARLSGDSLFDGTISKDGQPIEVIQELMGDIENMIARGVNKIGVSVVVLTPTFELFDFWLPSLGGWLQQKIQVFEDPIFNATTTGIRAVDICERIVALMHMWPSSLPAQDGIGARWQAERVPWAYIQNTQNPISYVVSLQLNTQIQQPEP